MVNMLAETTDVDSSLDNDGDHSGGHDKRL